MKRLTPTNVRLLVAASNAPTRVKNTADYVCTGTSDEVKINAALAALPTAGGRVELSEGSFSTAATISIAANQGLIGQGMAATTITGTAATYNVLHMGNRQASGTMSNYMSLMELAVSSVGGANSYDTVWVDGMGTGGHIENVKASEGKYNFHLTDIDQSSFRNLKAFNCRTAGIYCEAGLENTWGNVGFYNCSAALSDNSSACVLFDASAAQTSPNKFDRVSFDGGNLFYASTGLTGTIGMKLNVGATSLSLTNCLFENPQQHVVLIGQTFMSLRGVSFIQNSGVSTDIMNFQTNNHTVNVQDCRLQQATNAFNGASGYTNLVFSGRNTNQGTITNLFAGSFGSKQGTDTVFAGDGVLALGLNGQRYDYAFINKVAVSQSIQDSNTNPVLDITAATTPVNHFQMSNANTAGAPAITATGSDTNIDINIVPKGTGQLKVNGVAVSSALAKLPTYTVGASGADYTTIQAALNAATSGGTIYLTDSSYTITSGLQFVSSNVNLQGNGTTVIQGDASTVSPFLGPSTSGWVNNQVRGIVFTNTNATVQGVGINASNMALCHYADLSLNNFNTALNMSDTANITFYNMSERIFINNCNNGVQIIGSTPTNSNTFIRLRVILHAGGGGKGLNITKGQSNNFYDCDFEPATGTGLTGVNLAPASNGDVADTSFFGIYCEANATNVSINSNTQRTSFFGGQVVAALTTNVSDSGQDTQFFGTDVGYSSFNQYGFSTTYLDATSSSKTIVYKNNTSYAHVSSNLVRFILLNASDSSNAVRIENAGAGKNISSTNGTTETFSVDKAGNIAANSISLVTGSTSTYDYGSTQLLAAGLQTF